MMHKLSKKVLAMLLALVMSFSLVIPTVSAKGVGDGGDPDTIETESEIQEYASPGDHHYVNGRAQHAGTIYTKGSSSPSTYEEGIFYDVTENSDTDLYCVEFLKDFSAGYATVKDASAVYDSTTISQLGIGLWYIENTYGSTYSYNQIYLLQNIYIWRVLEGWAYSTYTDTIGEDVQNRIFNEAYEFANANLNAFTSDGLVYDMDSGNSQDVGYFEAEPSEPAELNLIKTSANSSITANNSCYSLEGAEYTVYTDSSCTSIAKTTDGINAVLTTKADGTTNTVEVEPGTYYVKETLVSKGYALDDTVYTVSLDYGDSYTVQSQDPPVNDPLVLEITKVSNETVNSAPSLEGAEFTIKYYDGYYNSANDVPSTATRTWTIKTVNNGGYYEAYLNDDCFVSGDEFYRTSGGAVIIPLGTITIEETKAPEGYTLNGGYSVTDSYGNTISDVNGVICLNVENLSSVGTISTGNAYTKEDELIRGGLSVQKVDADTGEANPQGNATLGGAEFSIYDSNDDYVMSITTDEYGSASTSDDALIYGTYTVKETKAPEGYLINEDWSATVNITQPKVIVPCDKPCEDPVMLGYPDVEKDDIETGENVPLGGASLQAVFTIYNESENAVVVDGVSYEPGQAVATITTDPETGYGTLGHPCLPYGHYKIVETMKPIGYTSEGITEREFDVTEDGQIVDMTTSDGAIYNQVVRADFSIRKINDEDHAMAGVTFQITSNTTGETHCFTTDENGGYSSVSDYALHSYNTNNGEAYDGLWFGIDAPVDDSLGALPYDTYTITELRSEANEGYTLWSDTLTVTEKDNNLVIDLFNITDKEIRIATTALEETTNSHYSAVSENTVIVDEIDYENLPTGQDYVFVSYLYNATTDEFVTNENNDLVATYTVFTPRTSSSHVNTEISFDSTDLGGCDIVVYEYLYTLDDVEGQLVTYEADPTEADQMIHFPAIETTAMDSDTGNHMSYADEEITIIDTVEYTNLRPGRTYTVTGVLMDKDTGEPVLTADGEQITSEATFVAEEADGTVDVEFVFDGTGIEGVTTVVFETIYYNNTIYAVHTDINDDDQTVYIPKIHTLAWADETGTNVASATEDTVLYDTVWYRGLMPDEDYHIFGVLLDAETREAELDSEGNEIYSDYGPFTAESSEGQVDVEYHIDASQLAGRRTVFFEILYHVDYDEETGEPIYTLIAEEDIADAEQETIYFPDVQTTAWDIDTEIGTSMADEDITIIDTVEYTHLALDHEYTVTGTLMNKETGEPMTDDSGEIITAETTFTPETSDGTVDVEFTFSGVTLANSAVVVFEELYYEDTQLAVHADIDDEGQTVYFPEIHTTAIDSDTQNHISNADEDITIIDTVTYENLKPGYEYTMTGTLVDKATGEDLKDDSGNVITAETTFTPETADGTVDIEFTFSGVSLAGTTAVAFESLTYNYVEVAVHADIDDEAQTVYLPEIHTTAINKDTGTHEGTASGTITIVDTIEYTNLIPGVEYTMTGELYNADTEKSIGVTAETVFTPETADGSVEVEFTFDASDLGDVTIAVFEYCYYDGNLVAEHTDITDTDQQVHLNAPVPDNSSDDEGGKLQTGEIIALSVVGAIALAAIIVLIVNLSTRKRKV